MDIGAHVVDQDTRPLRSKRTGNSATNSATGTRDYRDLAFKHITHPKRHSPIDGSVFLSPDHFLRYWRNHLRNANYFSHL